MKRIMVLCFFLLVLGYVLVTLLFSHTSRPYRVGAIYPMTGMASTMGSEFERGVRLAISNAQQQGVDIELIVEDSKTEAKTAVSAYHALRARGIDAVLTTVSGCASAIIPMAKIDGIVVFADVAKPNITKEYENVFRHSSTAEQEAEVILSHLKNNGSGKTLVCWMHDEYCLSLRDYLLSHGGDTVQFHDYAYDKEQNVETIVSKALTGQVFNAVVVIGFGSPLGNAIKAVREFGFKGDILANMGLTVTADARESAGEAIHGVFYTSMCFDRNDLEYVKYSSEFKTRYGTSPNDYSLLAYNSAVLLGKVAEKKLYDAGEARLFLINLQSVQSAGEKLTITSNRDILPPVVLSRYR